ncbi:MAG: hypothetical protein L0H73_05715, partial [Nitrococcus sp.]|nr:hypothetical protein [Nitrococcus sp.]
HYLWCCFRGLVFFGQALFSIYRATIPVGALVRPRERHTVYYTRKLSGFVQVLNFVPFIEDELGQERPPSELKSITFPSSETAGMVLALLNSSLFYWFLTIYSDVRNLNKREILGLPVINNSHGIVHELEEKVQRLMESYQRTSEVLTMRYKKHGVLHIQCIYPKKSKPIIDDIDLAYGRAIGFGDEELDFLVNYDVKYRMSGADDEA